MWKKKTKKNIESVQHYRHISNSAFCRLNTYETSSLNSPRVDFQPPFSWHRLRSAPRIRESVATSWVKMRSLLPLMSITQSRSGQKAWITSWQRGQITLSAPRQQGSKPWCQPQPPIWKCLRAQFCSKRFLFFFYLHFSCVVLEMLYCFSSICGLFKKKMPN